MSFQRRHTINANRKRVNIAPNNSIKYTFKKISKKIVEFVSTDFGATILASFICIVLLLNLGINGAVSGATFEKFGSGLDKLEEKATNLIDDVLSKVGDIGKGIIEILGNGWWIVAVAIIAGSIIIAVAVVISNRRKSKNQRES